MSRRHLALASSILVIAAVISIIVVSMVPLPDFPPMQAERFDASIAFIDEDNCVQLADLGRTMVTELRCEPEQGWIDAIKWTDSGIEITAYLNQPTTRAIDPATGQIIETRTGDEVIANPPQTVEGLLVNRPDNG